MATISVYLRITTDNSRWLDQVAESAGITKAQAIDTIITVARTEQWVIRPSGAPSIDRPGRTSPTAGPGTQEENSE